MYSRIRGSNSPSIHVYPLPIITQTQESNILKYFCLNAVMLGLILPPRPQQNGGVVNQQGHHYCDFVPIFVEAAE